MLKGKQRSYLRSIANVIPAIFQIGKGGVSDNTIKQFDEALEARELVKATVLKNSDLNPRQVCEELSLALQAEIVQVIGNRFVLYRQSRENKVIQLP
ncbi:MAG TPA: ribosome assembly RNA-binding protein YhbY [Thermoclostridium sp.]|nr:ribosome assembly RNA-binding protein YhbY [Thermoclostridium sp.]